MKRSLSFLGLLTDLLRQQYASEQQQREALEGLKIKVYSSALLSLLVQYADEKEQNLNRLRRSFKELNVVPHLKNASVVQLLLQQGRSHMLHAVDAQVAEAALITVLQQLMHLNMCNYGTMAAFAQSLQQQEVSRLMHAALLVEKATDRKLTELAHAYINPQAVPSVDCAG